VYIHTYIHTFNGLFSRTTWVSRHQKGKPFWILLKQEMMGWKWHQLDHMQIICTTLQTCNQTCNHASTPSLNFLRSRSSSWRPTNSVKALKAPALAAAAAVSLALLMDAVWNKWQVLFNSRLCCHSATVLKVLNVNQVSGAMGSRFPAGTDKFWGNGVVQCDI